MKFKNNEHEVNYHSFIAKDDVISGDLGRESFFYLIALNTDTARHINKLYDFNNHSIKSEEGPKEQFQTDSSKKITLLAFNLFNGYSDENNDMTPLSLFSIGNDMEYLLEAMKIRLL